MGGPPLSPLAWIILTLLGVLIGTAILLLARRARRIDDHPTCRGCRFDLVGLAERLGDKATCPECGAALSTPNAIRVGNRRVHRPLLALGTAIVLLSLLLGGAQTASTLLGPQRMKYMPVWVLTREARSGSPATADRAMVELTRRERADELTPRQTDAIVQLALKRQADSTAYWSSTWGDFVDAAWAGGRVTPEDRANYLLNGLAYALECRDRIRNGSSPAIGLDVNISRLGSATTIKVRFTRESLTVGGAPVAAAFKGDAKLRVDGRSLTTESSPATLDAPLGDQTVHTVWKVVLDDEDSSLPHLERTVTSHRRVTVVPPGTPLVQLIRDPEVIARTAAALSCPQVTLRPDGRTASLDLTATDLPCTIASTQVILRESSPPPGRAAREWTIAIDCTLIGGAGRTGRLRNGWSGMPLRGDTPLDIDAVDLVLEPAPEIGDHRPDIDAILGEPVIIRNVPVKRQP